MTSNRRYPREILKGLALAVAVLAAVMPRSAIAQSALPVTVPLDPARTYLRTSADPDARDTSPFELAALGLRSGEMIQIDRLGFYRNGAPPRFTDRVSGMIGIFSASATLLSSDHSRRVVDALDAGFDFSSPATCQGGVPTDVPEDFQISPTFTTAPIASIVVRVPERATHLFIAAIDCFYGDNDDPNGDFAVRISRADVDRDGVLDDVDACLPSDIRAFVDTGSGATTIDNVTDAQGCTIQDHVNALRATATTHGDYVSGIAALAAHLDGSGLIDPTQRGELVSGAARAR